MLFSYSWSLLLAAGAFVFFIMLVQAMKKSPFVGLTILGINIVFLFEYPDSFTITSIYNFSISWMDVISAAFLVVTFTQRKGIFHKQVRGIFLVFGILIAFSAVWGAIKYDPQSAFAEFRGYFWMFATLMWSTTLQWSSELFLRKFKFFLFAIGWLLVIAAVVHYSIRGFGGYGDDFVTASGELTDRRVLSSGQSLMIFFSFLACVSLFREYKQKTLFVTSGVVFITVLILSQQRTVWSVAIVTIFIAFLLDRKRSVGEYLIVFCGSLLCIFVLALGPANSLLSTITLAVSDTRTFDGRIEGWLALIADSYHVGPGAIFFGQPFGTGWTRIQQGRLVSFSPHNWYVSVFMRTGVLGLIAYLVGILWLTFAQIKRRTSLLFLLFTISTAVYSWTYNVNWFCAIFLGAAIVIVSNSKYPSMSSRASKTSESSRIHS